MKKIKNLNGNPCLFWCGLGIVLLSIVPYVILGENAVIPYHDQLDGELLTYIYQAKYLFSGRSVIPEFMGGASKTALLPPAPLAVLLFRVLPPFAALVLMQLAGGVAGYVGMYRLAELATEQKLIALAAALFYAFLPFLPVYGLSQYGMPLLLWCIWQLWHGQRTGRSLCYIALYGGLSSLALCGFAWLMVWAVALVVLAVQRKLWQHKEMMMGFGVLFCVYVAENLSLIGQMLGIGEGVVSHKSEYVLAGDGLLTVFWNDFLYNGEHSEDHHIWIVCLALVTALAFWLRGRNVEKIRRQMKHMGRICCVIAVLCLTAALWNCSAAVSLREKLGAVGAFQMDRVLWLTPMLWMLVMVLCLDVLWSVRIRRQWLMYGIAAAILGCVAVVTLKTSLVKPCIQKLMNPDYNAVSYSDYLAIGVMNQVDNYIEESEGVTKEEYRVASLGIDPAAALYYGFYTVDGYSNNYDLEYKHNFRRVIAPELAKSEYLQGYFDDWGNRCYLFSSECPGYYTVEKGGFYYQNLELDTAALRELGCDYILSAAYIANGQGTGLVLLNEEALETEDSYYRIFIYRVEG